MFSSQIGSTSSMNLLLVSMSMEEYREDLTTSHAVMIFWILWSVFMVGIVVIFYIIENDWLEG